MLKKTIWWDLLSLWQERPRIIDCYKLKNKEKRNEKAVEENYDLVLWTIIDESEMKE